MLDKIFTFFQYLGTAFGTTGTTATVLRTITGIINAASLVVGVKGFLQARNMLAKGQDILLNKTSAGGKIPVIYGTRRVGAQVVYMSVNANDSRDLYVVYALAVGEVDEIIGKSIELDGNRLTDSARFRDGGYIGTDKIASGNYSLNTVSQNGTGIDVGAGQFGSSPTSKYRYVMNLHHGAATQTADPMLIASMPEWTSAHKLNGIAYIAAHYGYDKEGIWSGVPQLTVQVRGKKVYDPRLDDTAGGSGSQRFNDVSTYAYSDNPALTFLDYITNNEYGKGLTESQINMSTFSSAANVCDTEVDNPFFGGVSKSLTWSGGAGDSFITIGGTDPNNDWWQNKIGELIDIYDNNGDDVITGKEITDIQRDEFFDQNPLYRVYFNDTLGTNYSSQSTGSSLVKIKRFHCNGYLDTNKNVMENAKELLSNMRGIFLYIDGKYELQIEDTGTSTFTITDDHIIADAGISVDYGNKDKKANKVIVEFFNANKKYELDTATVLHDATPNYYSDDNDEILEIKAEFPYISDPYIAYNMAKAILVRSRKQMTIQFLGTPEMYKLNVGDIVTLNYVGTFDTSQTCRVEALELQPNGLVAVSLIEYFDVYTWETPPEEPLEELANLPSAYAVKAPTNITFTDSSSSSTGRPILSWDAPTDYPDYEFRVNVVDDSGNQLMNRIVNTTFAELNFTPTGSNYVASITSLNTLGTESDAETETFSVSDEPVGLGDIRANAVTANTIDVNELSAISADMGSITAGSIDIGSGAFSVTSAGVLDATGATINGEFVAGSGSNIFTADADGIYLGNATFADAPFKVLSSGEVQTTKSFTAGVAGTDEIAKMSGTGDYRFWSGSETPSNASFSVDKDGKAIAKNLVLKLTDGTVYFDSETGFSSSAISQISTSTGTKVSTVSSTFDADTEYEEITVTSTTSVNVDVSIDANFGGAYGNATLNTAIDESEQKVPENFTLTIEHSSDGGSTYNTVVTDTFTRVNDRLNPKTTPLSDEYKINTSIQEIFISGGGGVIYLATTTTSLNLGCVDSDGRTTLSYTGLSLSGTAAGTTHRIRASVSTTDTNYDTTNNNVSSTTPRVLSVTDPSGDGFYIDNGGGSTVPPEGDITAVQITTASSSGLTGGANFTSGDANFTLALASSIDGAKTFTNNVVIQGDLDVQGTTTTIDTTNLDVKDKNITLNYGTGDTSANANGAGITIQDAVNSTTDATLTWNTSNDSFNFSHDVNVTGTIDSGAISIANSTTAATLLTVGSSSQTGYSLQNFQTDTLSGNTAYLIAYGSGNAQDGNFSMKNTNTGGNIFFQVGTAIPLTLTTTGSTFAGTISSGAINTTGAVTIDVDNQADGALRIEANQTNPNNDFYFAQEIISTLSGTTATTADREQGGIYMDINSTATGGDTSNEHRAFGMYIDLDSTGDADLLYGVYSNVTATPTTGSTTSVYGGYFHAEDNGGNGLVGTLIGVQGTSVSDNATSDVNAMYGGYFKNYNQADSAAITTSTAVYGEIEIPSGTADIYGTSYIFRAEYDNNGTVAQSNSTYLYYGNYAGVQPTNAYGVYIADAVDNYFGGTINSGAITTTGLTVDGVANFNANNINYTGSSPRINFFENDATDLNGQIINTVGTLRLRTVSDDAGTTTNRFILDHATGDISFYEDTGTTAKFFWDASAESLGIGTNSPVSYQTGAVLNVGNTSDTYAQINLTSSTSGKNYIGFGDATSGTGRYQGLITYDHSANIMGFGTAASTSYQMAIGSTALDVNVFLDLNDNYITGVNSYRNVAGNEIIDSDNISYTIVKSYAGVNRLWLGETSTYANNNNFYFRDTGSNHLVTINSTGLNIRSGGLDINSLEVIDSSRNLTNIGTISSGAITSEISGTDGNLITFNNSSGEIGSIETQGNEMVLMSVDRGLRIRTSAVNSIIPVGISRTNLDATIDLGSSGARFKDLYLSGNITSDYITADHGIKATDIWTSNEQPATDNAIYSGYGAIGNRGTFYITNGGGNIQIGNGATHNSSPTATFSTTGLSMASGKDIQINGTTVIDSDRNLDNINSLDVTSTTSDLNKFTFTDTNSNAAFTGLTIDYNASGTQAHTADRIHRALFVDFDTSQTGGNTTDENRAYGIHVDVRGTGDTDLRYGVYSYSETQHSSGTVTSNIGVYGIGIADDTGTGRTSNNYGIHGLAYGYNSGTGGTTNHYAGYFKTLLSGANDKNTATAHGVYAEVEIDNPGQAQTVTNTFGVRSVIDNDSASNVTMTNAYLFHGDYQGTIPSGGYGLYIGDAVQNYVGGSFSAGSFIKNGGTDAQFLKADGSVQSSSASSPQGTTSPFNASANTLTFLINVAHLDGLVTGSQTGVLDLSTGELEINSQGEINIKANSIEASKIQANTITGDEINTDLLNVKSFDNVSSTIKSHVTAGTKFPLARDGQAYVQRTGTYTGSNGSFVPVTITQVRDNAGYVAIFSGVLGDVSGGRVQYSLNNSTWVNANGNTNISWSAGTYRGYTYVYTGQITTLSTSQSTVYWRVYFSGSYNHTQLSLNVMMDNTR